MADDGGPGPAVGPDGTGQPERAGPPGAAAGGTVEAVDRILSTTRAVRKRLDLGRPVEEAVLLECVGLAQQAPSAGNGQGWRFVIVTDPEVKSDLARLYRAGARDYLDRALAGARDDQARRVFESAQFLAENLERVPALVIPCVHGRPSANLVHSAALFGSILPATWSFMLALRARGLGTSWTTLHLSFADEAAALLGIPADVTQVGLIPVGYYTGAGFKPAGRPPAQDITFFNAWGPA